MSQAGPRLSWCRLKGCFSSVCPEPCTLLRWFGKVCACAAGKGEHLCNPEPPRDLTSPWVLAGGGREDISEQHIQQHIYPREAAGADAQLEQDLGFTTRNKQRKSGTQN